MYFILLIYFTKKILGKRGIINTLSDIHYFMVYFTSLEYVSQRLLEERISIVVDKSEAGESPDFAVKIIKIHLMIFLPQSVLNSNEWMLICLITKPWQKASVLIHAVFDVTPNTK